MNHQDLHSALKTTVLLEVAEGGIKYKAVRLQHGKDAFVDTLHANPNSFSTAGLQRTDFLHFLGFRRSPCAFHGGECYCKAISANQDVGGLAKGIATAFGKFSTAAQELESCGLPIDQPEGWGYFYGKPSEGHRFAPSRPYGNGHVAPKSERMKESEDEFFRFIFTWIEGGNEKGWTTHYRAKHMPLSAEFHAALDFLGGFAWFSECPEFDFQGCWWRFTPHRAGPDRFFGGNADLAHRSFDSHAVHFSQGLKLILGAHADLVPHGAAFLRLPPLAVEAPAVARSARHTPTGTQTEEAREEAGSFDVALTFAGSERQYAAELAERAQAAGLKVFYDRFYPEQLWGKDLVVFFDRIYRKAARYCVMFISKEYADRMWTTHERRSAQARALEEKGGEYILPIRVDETDLEGLPPTLGYVSIGEMSIEEIAELLVKKVRAKQQR